ncbi:hypothetical protein LTR05_006281 [Lithohypha guttulata]|uniref:Sister chromatid cohesion protein Dcc1 n=1 Tax=Lithohypha guttulata TaxID=1690604 RepID=A0AAN7Y562_9EURO|nr:hypothetical protein LTR05_006281 [Lithohypha guttulata]
MSTQKVNFSPVAFNIFQPSGNVRLLELPEELLSIITDTSSGNSANQALYFKSSPAVEEFNQNGDNKEGHLHLCSNDKAWLVKQVSTSNSVYVTRTSKTPPDEDDLIADATTDTCGGITAFAKPTNTLELHAVPASRSDMIANEQLARLIPTIHDASQVGSAGKTSKYSVSQLHEHIPAPATVITQVLSRRCVFQLPWSMSNSNISNDVTTESPQGAKAYISSPKLLLETWTRLFEAATMSDTKITGDLEADMLLEGFSDIEDLMDSSAGDVYKAIAKTMFERDGYFVALALIKKATNVGEKDTINEMETARWVGNVILQVHDSQTGGTGIEKESFEKQWEDAVPTGWVKYCSVEVLGSACAIELEKEKEMVVWREYGQITAAQTGESTQAVATASSKGKRKWHEKFAASRNVKR